MNLDIHIPLSLQDRNQPIKVAKVYPIRLPTNTTFPKAESIEVELLDTSGGADKNDTETQQLLQCLIRERLGEWTRVKLRVSFAKSDLLND